VVKISAQSEHFSVLFLKVIVNFGFLNLFLDIWIQNPDPDSEYGSGSRIQAQIECGSNRIRIRIRNTGFFKNSNSGYAFHVSGPLLLRIFILWCQQLYFSSCSPRNIFFHILCQHPHVFPFLSLFNVPAERCGGGSIERNNSGNENLCPEIIFNLVQHFSSNFES
jgi:hypothetical protein